MPRPASLQDALLTDREANLAPSRWTRLCDRFKAVFDGADPRVCIAFWLFGAYAFGANDMGCEPPLNQAGLINNVLYVILLSAALDLVGPDIPKGLVLLADIIPAFATKLIAPYFIHLVPYSIRVLVFVFLSAVGMLVVAVSPSYTNGGTISSKIAGIVLASFSAGGGELSFVGLTHFYGPFSLASWGSGTGAAGLVGAGAYAFATSVMNVSVHATLFASALLPAVMALAFFIILPRAPLQSPNAATDGYYAVERGEHPNEDHMDIDRHEDGGEEEGLLGVSVNHDNPKSVLAREHTTLMVPLLLVFVSEYVINQGVCPTLLFPLYTTPFKSFRAFYPAYNAIYQSGVFISRSSTPFFRIHNLYLPALLQVLNLAVLTTHSLFNYIPNVYIVFAIIFWEGLLGGLVYVNTFAEISDRVPEEEREFSLGATTTTSWVDRRLDFEKFRSSQSSRFGRFIYFGKSLILPHNSGFLANKAKLSCRANKHGPPFIRSISSHFSGKLTTWQTTVIIFLWLYVSRNFAKIVGLECPEPLANLYSRSFFRATWITTGLDAGFWTAMKIKPKWLRDIASLVFTVYYLIAAEQADEKVRKVRGTLTLDHLRVSWNKATTPYLWALASLLRPRLTRYAPRAIRIPRPQKSIHKDVVNAWLYFDGPLSALRDQTCIVMDIPGGGFVAMGPRSSEDKLLSWAGQLKVPVLSVDYKKAPEYAYPFALHECYDVYHTIMSTNGRCLGLSGSTRPRIVVTGESAGGNLAVGMTLMALQSAMAQGWRGEEVLPRPDGLVLAYPALNPKEEATNVATEASKALQDKLKNSEDLNGKAAPVEDQVQPLKTRLAVSSMISYVHDRILTPEMMRAMIILYIGPHHRPDFNTDFYLSPVLAPDALLARFPKTYIMTGERDPLVDDTVIFAGRLRQAKLQLFRERQDLGLERSQCQFNEKDHVEVSLIPGVSHGFIQMAGFFPDAWKFINRSARQIESIFASSVLHESEYSLLQMFQNTTHQTAPQKPKGSSRSKGSANGHGGHHHRSFTGDSSGDDDKPLRWASNLFARRMKSGPSFGSSQLNWGLSSLENSGGSGSNFLAKLKQLEMTSHQDTFPPDEVNSAPESPTAFRPRGRSIASLDSEEDLLDRRMNGLAGGLMGLGERAQTPGA
ncbi:hypothetical protein N7532_000748 [Penicillium argentinense]|uniref:Alpha/beta hydrolase fold-3 domain-containing protein n=1 Tax=Penicillium argentinense TaxID=1131581 RepID=A0A9W9G5Y7_9EURO|nr:uncharacterized protein N7532_000748 [Penicillium argentinense]KAJ5112703.1 hypothetical protein N7532_000748 [Penicillium argentinense]